MAKKGTGWLAALGITAAGSAALAAAANRVFRTSVEAGADWHYGGNNKKEKKKDHPFAKYGDRPQAAKDWFLAQEMEDVHITSSVDDTPLHARYFACEHPKRLVLCAHGYRSNAVQHFAAIAPWLREQGCSLLFIDERGCGQSGGAYITYGAREKYDVMDWLDWLNERNPEGLPLYLYGVSMGATAVLCASEYVLPDNLAGIVADCGFVSMKEILRHCMRQWYHIDSHALLWSVDQLCREKAHFGMYEADAEKALRKCRIPTLIIHGTEDDFVPPSHAVRNYHACAAPLRDILWIEGAGHAASYYEDPEKYQTTVLEHFRRCETSS